SFTSRSPPPPVPTLFPYTTLFRSRALRYALGDRGRRLVGGPAQTTLGLFAHGPVVHPTGASRGHPRRPGGRPRGKTAHGGLLLRDRKSTRLNSSHVSISYAVFCLK